MKKIDLGGKGNKKYSVESKDKNLNTIIVIVKSDSKSDCFYEVKGAGYTPVNAVEI